MITYEPIIGLEIHAELMSKSKMFCGCKVVDSVTAPPNTAVCPVCLGMPGMLPVINRQAVEFSIKVAIALNCDVQHHNIFARKNYFYPDLAKAYQVTQYEQPIGLNGWVDIELGTGETKRIRIRRVHMEEDTGKLTHENGRSLVDYNRAGVPLLEIVSEPDIHSGEEARAYGIKIRRILRYLGVNSGDMEKGVLRVEPNISLRPMGSTTFGTRTELKNLNSFRALADGSAYEIMRQETILRAGGAVVQETRGWHDSKRITFSQRVKEEAEDYRYFDEPDLPPLFVDEEWITAVAQTLPELPDAKLARYQIEYDLSPYDAAVLADEIRVATWFETAVTVNSAITPKTIANWVINALFRLMNNAKLTIDEISITPEQLVELLGLIADQTINQNSGRKVLDEMFETGKTAVSIIESKGLTQISDEDALAAIVAQLLADNADSVAAYCGGNKKVRGFLIGQVMRATKGKANPRLVNDLLTKALA